MSAINEFELGMLLQALGGVEREARELCRIALTTHPELQALIGPLSRTIVDLDSQPAVTRLRQSSSAGASRATD